MLVILEDLIPSPPVAKVDYLVSALAYLNSARNDILAYQILRGPTNAFKQRMEMIKHAEVLTWWSNC